MARVLVVDDEEGLREFLVDCLLTAGHQVLEARDGLEALGVLKKESVHVLLTDLRMPRMDGMALLRRVKEDLPEIEVLVLTAHGSVEGAVEAMKLGAFDYLLKPLKSPDEVRLLVSRAAEHRALKDRQEGETSSEIRLSWGAPAMVGVIEALRKVARTDATVLLTGESGVGKEVAARALHRFSGRSGGPFVAVNCAAFSDTLLESELFGHEKGAFTGAVAQRRGKLELCDGGTFFLDEVGELKPELQARLLRVLQERRFERIGGNRTLVTDVRWVAATNRDLPTLIRQGTFREDLYHRLAVFPLKIPPLRERREDLIPLAESLLSGIAASLGRGPLSLSDGCRRAILAAPWSGNVRELRNALERGAILCEGSVLQAEDLLLTPAAPAPAAGATSGNLRSLDELEKDAIQSALARFSGNRRLAAESLGIGLRTLYDKLKKYGLE